MDKLLYGVAYYDEYMPYDRLEKDVEMMKAAGINVVRIAESTWSTLEPKPGVYNFEHIDRVLDGMEKAGIQVIVGTPTYAIPSWLAKEDPSVLALTKRGQEIYGRRQNMDITNPTYRYYAGRVIRRLMEHVAQRPCVIGYQLDNETKHYGSCTPQMQKLFKEYLMEAFETVEALNEAFGFAYWSNAVGSWDDLPDVRGTINASYGCAFERFRRRMVSEFLAWQREIVEEFRRPDQFVTQNFDFEWRGYSYGVQPDVDHLEASGCLTVAGVDIYHPTQDELTGKEIAFGGDIVRSLKGDNYLVLETEAQGFKQWLPYKGQLLLQAVSHVASGANMVAYWHWHSIHNAMETYWKGLLSHDFLPNPTYNEACETGAMFDRLSDHLVNLKKKNKVAILISNESLTALQWFPIDQSQSQFQSHSYNDVFRWLYDSLYEMNIECDILFPASQNLGQYDLILVPALYSAPEALLLRLDRYVENGGHLVVTYKSGFTNENVKVYPSQQPHVLSRCCGVTYSQFTAPVKVGLKGENIHLDREETKVSYWMELLTPTTAQVLASYDHREWGSYAAVTKNEYGEGSAIYFGCHTSKAVLKKVLLEYCEEIGLADWAWNRNCPAAVTVRKSYNGQGKQVVFYLNYSGEPQTATHMGKDSVNLLSGQSVNPEQDVALGPWGFAILEEK